MIAFIVACVILAGGAAFCAHTRQSLIKLAIEKGNARTSEEIAAVLDQGITVSASMILRISIARMLARLWYAWIIVTFGACFSVAYFLSGN